jgi:hypothetical protein
MTDLNAERKRRAGLADTGLCLCEEYLRMQCRHLCLAEALATEPERPTVPVAVLLRRLH